MKAKWIACMLILALLVPLAVSCRRDGSREEETTHSEPETDLISVYSGTPDTSWYRADDPKPEYTLTSADQFAGMLQLRIESNGAITFRDTILKLGCDILINPGTWEEIRDRGNGNLFLPSVPSSSFFKGTLDGQGHTISGFYIASGNSGYKSLLGSLTGTVTIKDLKITNSYILAPEADTKFVLGGVATRVTGDRSHVCFSGVESDVVIEEQGHTVGHVGGLIGTLDSRSTVVMENCKFGGEIRITGECAGGLIGSASHRDLTLVIRDCRNNGNIFASRYAGGLVGRCEVYELTETNNVNIGTVSAPECCGKLMGIRSSTVDPNNGARAVALSGSTLVRVMSYNIRLNLPRNKDGSLTQVSQNRVNGVKSEIERYDPDILGVQEDTGRWTANLFLSGYNVIQDDSLPENVERQAIYYKKGMTLLESRNVWLTSGGTASGTALTVADLYDPNGEYRMDEKDLAILGITPATDQSYFLDKLYTYVDKNGVTQTYEDGYMLLYTRNATFGVFDINGTTLIAVNTHIQHRTIGAVYSNSSFQQIRNLERQKEFEYLYAALIELEAKYPGAKVVMTGDWNDVPFSDVYQRICKKYGYLDAAYAADEKYGVAGSCNAGFNNDPTGGNLLGHNCPNEKEGDFSEYLDHIFVKPGAHILKCISGEGKATVRQANGSEISIYTSDHLPMIADISFTTPKSGSFIQPEETDLTKPSVYSGVPDTSWYHEGQTEYLLTTADQFVGMMRLRQNSAGKITFEGVTIRLARDMIINEGTVEEILARNASDVYMWPSDINSNYFFKGTLDGQGHSISGVCFHNATSGVRGMFGGVSGNAAFRNFQIVNSCMIGPDEDKNLLGVLIAKVASSANVTISDVVVDCAIYEGKGTVYWIGGFVGQVEGNCTLTMNHCAFLGKIAYGNKGTQIGGFVGAVRNNGSLILDHCQFGGIVQGKEFCGQLVGFAEGSSKFTHTGTTSTGTVSPLTAGQETVGKDSRE